MPSGEKRVVDPWPDPNSSENDSSSNPETENNESSLNSDVPGSPDISLEETANMALDELEINGHVSPVSSSIEAEASVVRPWWWGQEEIVISGISCRFPESDNILEFRDNLLAGRDLVTEDDRRWDPGFNDLPVRQGKLKELKKFDSSAFGVHPKQAHLMDPQMRLLLEVVYECIVDSGTNPQDLRGKKVGVFVGVSGSETEVTLTSDSETLSGYSLTGCARSMFANRLSYAFDFRGPSFAVDTACSSSLVGLRLAVDAIRGGQCEAAIVAGSHLTLASNYALQFLRMGMLSKDGYSRSFDADGQGYVRSEGVAAILLQRHSAAHRIYADIVNIGTNTDGYKEQGITFPGGDRQAALLREVYAEAKINPHDVSFVECHGTGTMVGDPEECFGITEVFCQERKTPLLIGSVKSNMGHAEPASALASIAKVIIAMETGFIAPNLHFNTPNPNIAGLLDGRLQVVTEKTPFKGGLCCVNSFGFGGSNSHVVLRAHSKLAGPSSTVHFQKLICWAGRTPEAVNHMLDYMKERPTDHSTFALMSEHANVPLSNMPYRGYTLIPTGTEDPPQQPIREIQKVSGMEDNRPVWWIYSGMGTQWPAMARDMLRIDGFRESILACAKILKPYGINLYHLLTDADNEDIYSNILFSFVAIAAVQIALTDVLRTLEVPVHGMIGHSTGEISCAYADGCLSMEETLLSAYWRGKCVQDGNLPAGAMAAVGLTWEEASKRCPPDVIPACHNSEESVTISGPEDAVAKFVQELKDEDIFAKEVRSAGIAFHSPYMQNIAESLKNKLSTVIRKCRYRSHKWISSSIPEEDWDTELASRSTPAYFVNNLTSPVLFSEAMRHIPENAIVIEISPHCLLQALLKRSIPASCFVTGLMKVNNPDNVGYFLDSLGKAYLQGLHIKLPALYGPVIWPVPKGTPMLGAEFKWDHSADWYTITKEEAMASTRAGSSGFRFAVDPFNPEKNEQFLIDHVIDGRRLYPFTGYLYLAWKGFCKMNNTKMEETPILMQDIEVMRATPLSKAVKFDVVIMSGQGKFEVVESGSVVACGRISAAEEVSAEVHNSIVQEPEFYEDANCCSGITLDNKDIYKEYLQRGYDYGAEFRGILSACNQGHRFELAWKANWVSFLDTLLQSALLQERVGDLHLPTRLLSVYINPQTHMKSVTELEDGSKTITGYYDCHTETFLAGGIKARNLGYQTMPRRLHQPAKPTVEYSYFTPYFDNQCFQQLPEFHTTMKEYEQVLKTYSRQFLSKLVSSDPNFRHTKHIENLIAGLDKLEGVNAEVLAKYQAQLLSKYTTANFGLLKFLLDACKLKPSGFVEGSKRLLSYADVESDVYWELMKQERTIRTCLGCILEQICSHFSTCLELEPRKLEFTGYMKNLIEQQPLLESSWSVLYKDTPENIEDKVNDLGGEILIYDLSSDTGIPSTVKGHDLVVAERVLHLKPDPLHYLKQMRDLILDDGLAIVCEITQHFDIAFAVECLKDDIEPTSDLERHCGLYFDHDQWCKLFKEAGYRVIGWERHDFMVTNYVLRKSADCVLNPTFVNIDDIEEFTWVPELQQILENNTNGPANDTVWLTSTDHSDHGSYGFCLCLKEEQRKVMRIRSIFNSSLDGKPWKLDFDDPVVQERLKDNLMINVYRDGKWGTMRHQNISNAEFYTNLQTEYAYINTFVRGDLSTLTWIESGVQFVKETDKVQLCSVYYAPLNFRDIMLATGRISVDIIPGSAYMDKDCLLGLEYSGRLKNGRRIMGVKPAQALATVVAVNEKFYWDVPENWTLQEASTVPVVYLTAYYGLFLRGQLKPHNSVLIHAGSGGVGQASIRIALSMGCEVFTTVGTAAKRAFLTETFPQLKPENIFNSRTAEFEEKILKATKGRGVDVVLNSLADEMLQASVRCLAQHGRFLEIGKYDIERNTALGMSILGRNATIHGVLIDALMDDETDEEWRTICKYFEEGIKQGVVQPLPTTIFDADDIEKSFRFMANGSHIGKVVVRIREEEEDRKVVPKPITVRAVARPYCNPDFVYLITGGLGGFGLELAQHLINQGAKKLVLTSRSGVQTGYQRRLIWFWTRRGIDVRTSKLNTFYESETRELILLCQSIGPIGGIFHLAMVLRDSLFENQTIENFKLACEPKYYGTKNLDAVSRELCDENLRWFVAFSSVASGLGNEGQTSYGYSNSCMERIMEQRMHDGYPGMAMQWGAIGDTGVVLDKMGDNSTVVGGTLPQRIPSCMNTLNLFLTFKHAVVCCYVRADQRRKTSGNKIDVLEAVSRILGVEDSSTLDLDAKLTDFGLDSLMGVELRQMLERDFDVVLAMKEIRTLTLRKLKNMVDSGGNTQEEATGERSEDIKNMLEFYGLRLEPYHLMPTEPLVRVNTVEQGQPLFCVTSIEGTAAVLSSLAENLTVPLYSFQFTPDTPTDSVDSAAKYYIQEMRKIQPEGPYNLAGYSYGACIALEMALQLQEEDVKNYGQPGKSIAHLILLDASHMYWKAYKNLYRLIYNVHLADVAKNPIFETELLIGVGIRFAEFSDSEIREELLVLSDFEERREHMVKVLMNAEKTSFTDAEVCRFSLDSVHNKYLMADKWDPEQKPKLVGDITLIKSEGQAQQSDSEDYGLAQIATGNILTHLVGGDHDSFIQADLAKTTAALMLEALGCDK